VNRKEIETNLSEFIQLHILTSYPPSNLNRDDTGRPKTAMFGTSQRLRVSSQSLKRAFRTSDVFLRSLGATHGLGRAQGEQIGIRTKDIGNLAHAAMREAKIPDAQAHELARKIAAVFGKSKDKGKSEKEQRQIEQLAFISLGEKAGIDALVAKAAKGDKISDDEIAALLTSGHRTPDVALFGRMLADHPDRNVEAACQVAHALSVHKVAVEEDFYSAVDDLNTREEDAGAGHLGTTEFGAALFYLYICIDRTLLLQNLDGDEALAQKTLRGLAQAACLVSPTRKQNSFASRERAHFVLAERGDQQPRSLSVSFLHPLEGKTLLTTATDRLQKVRKAMEDAYGACAREHRIFEPVDLRELASGGEGKTKKQLTFEELIKFVSGPPEER
jgi:CRISPR system Cascade subunit CasC